MFPQTTRREPRASYSPSTQLTRSTSSTSLEEGKIGSTDEGELGLDAARDDRAESAARDGLDDLIERSAAMLQAGEAALALVIDSREKLRRLLALDSALDRNVEAHNRRMRVSLSGNPVIEPAPPSPDLAERQLRRIPVDSALSPPSAPLIRRPSQLRESLLEPPGEEAVGEVESAQMSAADSAGWLSGFFGQASTPRRTSGAQEKLAAIARSASAAQIDLPPPPPRPSLASTAGPQIMSAPAIVASPVPIKVRTHVRRQSSVDVSKLALRSPESDRIHAISEKSSTPTQLSAADRLRSLMR